MLQTCASFHVSIHRVFFVAILFHQPNDSFCVMFAASEEKQQHLTVTSYLGKLACKSMEVIVTSW